MSRKRQLGLLLCIALGFGVLTLAPLADAQDEPAEVVRLFEDSQGASMAVGPDGNPVIAYFDNASGPFHESIDGRVDVLTVVRCGNPTCTAGNEVSQPDSDSQLFGFRTLVQINDAGNPVVLYSTYDNYGGSRGWSYVDHKLRVLTCGDSTCSSDNTVETVLDGPEPYYRSIHPVALEFDSAGLAVLAYNVGPQNPAVVMNYPGVVRCLDATCSTRAEPFAVGQDMLAFALDSNDNPVMVVTQQTPRVEELVSCLDPTCQATTTYRITPSLQTDSRLKLTYAALALSADDVPFVAYRYGPVEVLACADSACSSATTELIDHVYGPELAMDVDVDGHPVIAYLDNWYGGNGSERSRGRIARCSSVDCADRTYATTDVLVSSIGFSAAGQPVGLSRSTDLLVCDGPLCAPNTPLCQGFPATTDLNDAQPRRIATTTRVDVVLGTDGDDVIDTGAGDDLVCAGAGDDTVNGGLGDDRLLGGAGNDVISGGDGDDTIHGNRGDDVLDGDAGDDRIFGYADDDVISGGDGDDRLHGHFGRDRIAGDAGDDRIFGYGDGDVLSGGEGADLIGGNRGDDVINGGPGDDTLYGSDGKDTINAGPGDDVAQGNSDTDVVNGGDGNDSLDGGIFRDECNGGNGTDTAVRCEAVTGIP